MAPSDRNDLLEYEWEIAITRIYLVIPRTKLTKSDDCSGHRPSKFERKGQCIWLLVVGAIAVVRGADSNPIATGAWIRRLRERKPARLVSVAGANKTARIGWAILAFGETWRVCLVT